HGGVGRFLVIEVPLESQMIGESYYISVEITGAPFYYSEPFCVRSQDGSMVKIVWASDCKVGDMIYNDKIRNIINLDATIVPESNEIEEEVEENGLNDDIPTLQILRHRFKLSA